MAKIKILWVGQCCMIDTRNIDENIAIKAIEHVYEYDVLLENKDAEVYCHYNIEDFFVASRIMSDLYLNELFGKDNIIDILKKYNYDSIDILNFINNYDEHINNLIIRKIIE